MREVPLSEVEDDLRRYLREAEEEAIVILRHGTPAGVLIGFKSAAEWLDYRMKHDPQFLRLVEKARSQVATAAPRRSTR